LLDLVIDADRKETGNRVGPQETGKLKAAEDEGHISDKNFWIRGYVT
jgi:hypothetical protein